tara:strand:- start:8011 stop:8364 length:354 start_codon:yes stop_codon:yes gene_type:complete
MTITITILLLAFLAYFIYMDIKSWDTGVCIPLTLIGVFIIFVSILAPLGDDIVTIHPATTVETSREIIIQPIIRDIPTTTTNDMNFIGKELEIVKTQTQTMFGWSVDPPKYVARIAK